MSYSHRLLHLFQPNPLRFRARIKWCLTFLHSVPYITEAPGRMTDGKVGHTAPKDRIDQLNHPTDGLRLIPSEDFLQPPKECRTRLQARGILPHLANTSFIYVRNKPILFGQSLRLAF